MLHSTYLPHRMGSAAIDPSGRFEAVLALDASPAAHHPLQEGLEGEPRGSGGGSTPINPDATRGIARRLVDQGRFESISEACREGLRRLDAEQRIVDMLRQRLHEPDDDAILAVPDGIDQATKAEPRP